MFGGQKLIKVSSLGAVALERERERERERDRERAGVCVCVACETVFLTDWDSLSSSRVGWPASEHREHTRDPPVCPRSVGIPNMCHHSQLFMWVLGIKLRSSCLQVYPLSHIHSLSL